MHVLLIILVLATTITATSNKPTNIKDHPYVWELLKNNKHWCGAILISSRIILPTAQCTFKVPKKNLTFIAGSSIPENLYVRQYKIFQIHIPKKYDPSKPSNDISVICPAFPIKPDEKFVMPIPVAHMHYPPGIEVVMTGWKLVKNQPVLLSTKLTLKGSTTCANEYKKLGIVVTQSELCASGKNHAVCKGDSGAALLIGDKLVGMASKIVYPTCRNYSGIYTSFYHFKLFVKKVAKKVLNVT